MRPALTYGAILLSCVVAGCSGTSTTTDSATDRATETPHYERRPHHRHRHTRGAYASADPHTSVGTHAANGSFPCDDQQFVNIQSQYAAGAVQGDREVDVCGTVARVLPARTTRSGLHGYFVVQLATGGEIEIVSDLDRMNAPAWPWVKRGDYTYVRGRYYYDDASSQGIDWTHHGTSQAWSTPGYVVVAGTEYQ